jgi:hypothetical protein
LRGWLLRGWGGCCGKACEDADELRGKNNPNKPASRRYIWAHQLMVIGECNE